MRKVSKHKNPDDFLCCNQQTTQAFSERIWKNSLAEVLVESRLGDWGANTSNNLRKVGIHSGKNINRYSFRHSYITMRLKAGVPVPVIAANTDTSVKYIQEHYIVLQESREVIFYLKNPLPSEIIIPAWMTSFPNDYKGIIGKNACLFERLKDQSKKEHFES